MVLVVLSLENPLNKGLKLPLKINLRENLFSVIRQGPSRQILTAWGLNFRFLYSSQRIRLGWRSRMDSYCSATP